METIVKSCEDLLNFAEICTNEDVKDVIVCAVFDILQSIVEERVGMDEWE